MSIERMEGWAALRLLARLKLKARLRRLRQDLRKPLRLIGLLVFAAFLVLWLWRAGSGNSSLDTGGVVDVMIGGMMLAFTVLTIWGATRNGSITFHPEEVHFLFPGPIGTRALLLNHALTRTLESVGGAAFFALFVRIQGTSFLRVWFVFSVFFMFLVLLGAAVDVTLVDQPERVRKRRARLIILTLISAVGLAVGAAWWQDRTFTAQLGRYAVVPVRPFALLLTGREAGSVLPAAGIVLGVCAALLARLLVFRGDIREAAHDKSLKLAKAVARVSKGNPFADKPRERVARSMPMLPRLGGAGPHAWRQLLALRRTRKSFVMLIVVVLWVGLAVGWSIGEGRPDVFAAIFYTMLCFSGPMYVQCDFRSDHASFAWLRSLPVAPGILAFGNLLASAIVLVTMLLVMTGWILFVVPAERALLWVGLLLAAPAFMMLQLAVENGAFLLYPVRMVRTQSSGMSIGTVMRLYAVMAVKMLVLIVALIVPAAFGGLCWWLTRSPVATGAVALIVLGLVTSVFVWLVGRIFVRIDPARSID